MIGDVKAQYIDNWLLYRRPFADTVFPIEGSADTLFDVVEIARRFIIVGETLRVIPMFSYVSVGTKVNAPAVGSAGMLLEVDRFGFFIRDKGYKEPSTDEPTYNISGFYTILPLYRIFSPRPGPIRLITLQGFLVGGYRANIWPPSPSDALLMRLDPYGNIVWSYKYGTDTSDEKIIKIIRDGILCCDPFGTALPYPYAMVGYTTLKGIPEGPPTNGLDDKNFLFMAVDSLGDVVKACVYGGDGVDVATYIEKNPQGGFFIVGYSNSFSSRYGVLLLRVRDDCRVMWSRLYLAPSGHLFPYAVRIDGQGRLVISGTYRPYLSTTDGIKSFVFQVDTVYGNIINQKMFVLFDARGEDVDTLHTYGYEITILPDGNYAFVGNATLYEPFDNQILLFLSQQPTQPLAVESWSRAYIIKLNPALDTLWVRQYRRNYDKSFAENSLTALYAVYPQHAGGILGVGQIGERGSIPFIPDTVFPYIVNVRSSDGKTDEDLTLGDSCWDEHIDVDFTNPGFIGYPVDVVREDLPLTKIPVNMIVYEFEDNAFLPRCPGSGLFRASCGGNKPISPEVENIKGDVYVFGEGDVKYEVYTPDGRLLNRGYGKKVFIKKKGVYIIRANGKSKVIIRR